MRRTENTAAASVGERTAPSSKASRHVRASSQQAALGQNQHPRGELEGPRPPGIVEPHAEASPNERQAETEEDKQAWQADPAGDPGRHERGDDHTASMNRTRPNSPAFTVLSASRAPRSGAGGQQAAGSAVKSLGGPEG